jgi:hypothetical protein
MRAASSRGRWVIGIGLVVAAAAATIVVLYLQAQKDVVEGFDVHRCSVTAVAPDGDIAANQRLDLLVKRGVVREIRVPAEALEEGAVTDLEDLAGMITTTPIRNNEQIRIAHLTVDVSEAIN